MQTVSLTPMALKRTNLAKAASFSLWSPSPCSVKPRVDLLAESDAESSSAGSSEEEDMPVVELSGIPGERKIPPGVEG